MRPRNRCRSSHRTSPGGGGESGPRVPVPGLARELESVSPPRPRVAAEPGSIQSSSAPALCSAVGNFEPPNLVSLAR